MKCDVSELGLFGGTPAFKEPLQVGRPAIKDVTSLLARIERVLQSRRFTNDGPCVQEFEARIAQMTGAGHCVATCNATVALSILIKATGLAREVIVPSFTFVATAHALQWHGITPVFCDVDPVTHNIDPSAVERAITARTTGIIGVHLWGRPCNIGALTDIASRHGLALLFDAAHAFGCNYNGRQIGNHGDAEVFSFHATKFISTFEGGAIVTNDETIAAKARLMRNFGFSGYDTVTSLGINGKMPEISAVMGLTSLDSMEAVVEWNRRNYLRYFAELEGVEGISVLPYKQQETPNYQYVVAEVPSSAGTLARDELQRVLWAEGVLARRYFFPGCHLMDPYRSLSQWSLPCTEQLAQKALCLPTGPAVATEQVSAVCSLIRFALEHSTQIRKVLQRATLAPQDADLGTLP